MMGTKSIFSPTSAVSCQESLHSDKIKKKKKDWRMSKKTRVWERGYENDGGGKVQLYNWMAI